MKLKTETIRTEKYSLEGEMYGYAVCSNGSDRRVWAVFHYEDRANYYRKIHVPGGSVHRVCIAEMEIV